MTKFETVIQLTKIIIGVIGLILIAHIAHIF